MIEWLKTVIAGAVGGMISGGFLLLSDYLKHRWKKTERLQELLTERFDSACAQLWKKFNEFSDAVSHVQEHGAAILRGNKESVAGSDEATKEASCAERIDCAHTDLREFVITNEMFLRAEVVRVYQKYTWAFDLLRFEARKKTENGYKNDTFVAWAVKKLMREFEDRLAEAVKAAFAGEVDLMLSEDRRSARSEGGQLVKELRAEADKIAIA